MAVTGIGGLFFRARDPEALLAWYRDRLGIVIDGHTPWQQAAGPTMIVPFPADSDYWPAERQWMLNLRVDDLAALLDSLRAAGTTVVEDPTWNSPEIGRFARIADPEGNPIELWQPPAA